MKENNENEIEIEKRKEDVGYIKESSWHRLSKDPYVDWIFMLMVAIVTAVTLITISVSKYIDVSVANTTPTDTSATSTRPLIDKEKANKISNIYIERMTRTSAVFPNKSSIPDPSN